MIFGTKTYAFHFFLFDDISLFSACGIHRRDILDHQLGCCLCKQVDVKSMARNPVDSYIAI